MKIYYLAHPVRPFGGFSEQDNLKEAGQIQEILWHCGIIAVMPWYSFPLSFPHRTDRDITAFLKMDCELVKRFDGLVLSGHHLSEGMQLEFNSAKEAELEVIDLLGVEPGEIASRITLLKKERLNARPTAATRVPEGGEANLRRPRG